MEGRAGRPTRDGCKHGEIQIGPLAQSVEHLTFNQVVAGSIPARPTIIHIYVYILV